MATSSRNIVKHHKYGTEHYYKLVFEIKIAEDADCLSELEMMKSRIDGAFADLLDEAKSNAGSKEQANEKD